LQKLILQDCLPECMGYREFRKIQIVGTNSLKREDVSMKNRIKSGYSIIRVS